MFLFSCVFVALYFIRPFELIPALKGQPFLQVFGGMGFLVLIVNIFVFKKTKLFENGTDQLMVGFFMAILLSYGVQAWLSATIYSFEAFFPTFVGYFLVAYSMKSVRQINIFYWIIIGCLLLMVVEGINQANYDSSFFGINIIKTFGYVESGDIVAETRIKWVGILSDPNDLAMALVLPIPFLLSKLYKGNIIFAAPSFAVLLYGLYLTKSRGGFIAFILAGLSYIVIRYRSVRGLVVGCIFCLVVVMYAPLRMGEISTRDESAYGRLEAWYAGYQMFKSSPIFGVGMDSFAVIHTLTAHNSFVLVFSEIGVLGAFFFTGLFFIPLRGCYELVFKTKTNSTIDKNIYEMYLVSISSLVGMISAMFFLSRAYILLPYILIGLCSSLYSTIEIHENRKIFNKNFKNNSFKILVLTLGLILLVNITIKTLL